MSYLKTPHLQASWFVKTCVLSFQAEIKMLLYVKKNSCSFPAFLQCEVESIPHSSRNQNNKFHVSLQLLWPCTMICAGVGSIYTTKHKGSIYLTDYAAFLSYESLSTDGTYTMSYFLVWQMTALRLSYIGFHMNVAALNATDLIFIYTGVKEAGHRACKSKKVPQVPVAFNMALYLQNNCFSCRTLLILLFYELSTCITSTHNCT